MRVAILGASDRPDKYAFMAFKMLKEYGHEPLPVHPSLKAVEGVPVVPSLQEIEGPVDTLTMYVGPKISSGLKEEILKLQPKRVIFNPGSENPDLIAALKKNNIHVVEGCTLVLLRTNQFEEA